MSTSAAAAAAADVDFPLPCPSAGTRIALGHSRGTVRFVGHVPPTKGVWLGVEWDDGSERGKHDGTHEGVRYFTCRRSNAGSFIRPSAKIALGSSFLKALRNKYIDADEEDTEAGKEERLRNARQYTRRNLADIDIEAPNMSGVKKRLAMLDRLRNVGLGGWKMTGDPEDEKIASAQSHETYVARAFDEDECEGQIRNTCPAIQMLDLSRSLLSSWGEVGRITCELHFLETLLLHFNRFAPIECANDVPDRAFERLKELRLDGTFISWHEICLLATKMPSLELLQLGGNDLSTFAVSADAQAFGKLTTLNLANNKIADWTSLMDSVESCQKLQRLVVSDNPIHIIPAPIPSFKRSPIHHVSLAGNGISSWKDLENLSAWFVALKSLVISLHACTFLKSMDERDARPLVIARMASIETLNNAIITEQERRDAELFYLSTVEREGLDRDAQEVKHPRYALLCRKYGRSSANDNGAASVSSKVNATLRSKLLPVRIRASATPPTSVSPFVTSSEACKGEIEISLLTTTPIRLLQGKIARSLQLRKGVKSIASIWALLAANIDPSLLTVVQLRNDLRPAACDEGDEEGRIVYELDNLEWDLAAYNFCPGDELVVVVEQ